MASDELIMLTPQGKIELEKEAENLKTVKRRQILERIHDLSSAGDASDDTDYENAKEELIQLDARVREILNILEDARIVEHEDTHGVVAFGTTVTVTDESGEEDTWTIVGPQEANSRLGKISNVSPVGSALLGKRVGDSVSVNAPGGEIVFHIKDVQ
jgi:transcription elongation factor GreA